MLSTRVVGRHAESGEPVGTLDAEGRLGGLAVGLIDDVGRARLGLTGAVGEVHPLAGGGWLVGIGSGAPVDWRGAGAALAGAHAAHGAHGAPGVRQAPVLAWEVGGLDASRLSALVIGLKLASYRFRVSRDQPPAPGVVELVTEDAAAEPVVDLASVLAEATALSRDLANTPSETKSPEWLVATAAALAGEVDGLRATVFDAARCDAEGFGGLRAVGGGSARPPALLRLDWAPSGAAPADHRHLVLVGKGVTFDTGGISIKPADGMHLMRTDMAGGASVIAAMLAIGRLGVPTRVTALVPAAENHVSGSAYRPGDIVRHYDGTTTEVVNTDAEGRMLLADALGYAVRELAPDVMVDVATLTGAMKVSLGLRTGGLFAGDDELAGRVLAAGERAGERWWRMPLLDHVADEVRSPVADLRQAPPGPGAIGAALFLREFTRGVPWVHLDIAGPARCEQPYAEVTAGATGFAARTLVELARGYAVVGGGQSQ